MPRADPGVLQAAPLSFVRADGCVTRARAPKQDDLGAVLSVQIGEGTGGRQDQLAAERVQLFPVELTHIIIHLGTRAFAFEISGVSLNPACTSMR